MSLEHDVMADALYVARYASDWSGRPYWLLRRCVIPYVLARQFLVLRRDGLPVAFAGWAFERAGAPRPWRDDRYLPSVPDIARAEGEPGFCCVTDIISASVEPQRVAAEVARWLDLPVPPPWIERDARRRLVAIHGAVAAPF